MIFFVCLSFICASEQLPAPVPAPNSTPPPQVWMKEETLQAAMQLQEYLIKNGNLYGVEAFLKEYYPELFDQLEEN